MKIITVGVPFDPPLVVLTRRGRVQVACQSLSQSSQTFSLISSASALKRRCRKRSLSRLIQRHWTGCFDCSTYAFHNPFAAHFRIVFASIWFALPASSCVKGIQKQHLALLAFALAQNFPQSRLPFPLANRSNRSMPWPLNRWPSTPSAEAKKGSAAKKSCGMLLCFLWNVAHVPKKANNFIQGAGVFFPNA